MAAPGYLPHQGVLSVEEADELGELTQNAPDYLKTKGRYKPYGVIHRKDRLPDDDEDIYFQKIRRKGFESGGPVDLGPGSGRDCTNAEDEVYRNGIKYCRKKCKQGWTRNQDTHRCYKQDAVRRRRFECREGYTRNQATGRCRKFAIDLDDEEAEEEDIVGDVGVIDFDELFGQDADAIPLNEDELGDLFADQDIQDDPVGQPVPIPADLGDAFWDEADAVDINELF
jgi:hypothetical protein